MHKFTMIIFNGLDEHEVESDGLTGTISGND